MLDVVGEVDEGKEEVVARVALSRRKGLLEGQELSRVAAWGRVDLT